MTGVFYTSPIMDVILRCFDDGMIPVFPSNANIDQVKGVGQALDMGYERIAVTVAHEDNARLDEIRNLGFLKPHKIFIFALCSTGVSDDTARKMVEYGDIIWSCASKPVRKMGSERCVLQIGLKIPLYVMNRESVQLILPRLRQIDPTIDENLSKMGFPDKRLFVAHDNDKLKVDIIENIDYAKVKSPYPLV